MSQQLDQAGGMTGFRHDPAKAARILKVTKASLLKYGVRGISVADIAKAAQIGKGTVYLYWRTKEELVADVIAGDFLEATDDYHAELAADPDAVRPERFCWSLLRSALDRPLVRAVQVSDVQTIGLLTEHEGTRGLLEHLGPGVLNRDLLRVWRSHGLARGDWEFISQAYAVRALLAGFFALETLNEGRQITDPKPIFEATVRALLDPVEGSSGAGVDVAAAATEVRGLLSGRQDAVRRLLTQAEA